MPLIKRQIEAPDHYCRLDTIGVDPPPPPIPQSNQPDIGDAPVKPTVKHTPASSAERLRDVSTCNTVGVITQLSMLASYATEMFKEISDLAQETNAGLADLQSSVAEVQALAPVTIAFLDGSTDGPLTFKSAPPWRATGGITESLFTPKTRSKMIEATYDACHGAPAVHLLDSFMPAPGTCMKKFSDPTYFFQEWVNAENARQKQQQQQANARKRRRRGHKRSGEANDKSVVAKVNRRRNRVSQMGVEFGSVSISASHTTHKEGAANDTAAVAGGLPTNFFPSSRIAVTSPVHTHAPGVVSEDVDLDVESSTALSGSESGTAGAVAPDRPKRRSSRVTHPIQIETPSPVDTSDSPSGIVAMTEQLIKGKRSPPPPPPQQQQQQQYQSLDASVADVHVAETSLASPTSTGAYVSKRRAPPPPAPTPTATATVSPPVVPSKVNARTQLPPLVTPQEQQQREEQQQQQVPPTHRPVRSTEAVPTPPPVPKRESMPPPTPEPVPVQVSVVAQTTPVPKPVTANEDKNVALLAKYKRMLSVGLPQGAVEQKMLEDGVDSALMFGVNAVAAAVVVIAPSIQQPAVAVQAIETETSDTVSVAVVDPRLAKYLKMQKVGLPQGAIENQMQKDGVDSALIFGNTGAGATPGGALSNGIGAGSASGAAAMSSDPKLIKYVRMQKVGLPQGAIEQQMTKDGMDPTLLFGAANSGSEVKPAAYVRTLTPATPPPPPTSGGSGGGGMGGMLAQIQEMKALKKVEPRSTTETAAPVKESNPMLAAILAGPKLRSAADRGPVVEKEPVLSAGAQLLTAIQGKQKQLKRVVLVPKKEKEEADAHRSSMSGMGVAAILARRMAIVGNDANSDSEGSGSDSGWDDEDEDEFSD